MSVKEIASVLLATKIAINSANAELKRRSEKELPHGQKMAMEMVEKFTENFNKAIMFANLKAERKARKAKGRSKP